MKHFIVPLLGLLLLSCEITYNGSERLVVNGTLLDENNQPIPDQDVEFWVYLGSGGLGSDADLINFTSTDNQGNFLMILPSPTNEEGFRLELSDPNNMYQSKKYLRILDTDFSNFKYYAGNIVLYKQDDVANLYVEFNQTSSNSSLIEVAFEGIIADWEIWVNPPETENEDYEPYVPYYYYKNVRKNQTLTISYTVRDNTAGTTSTYESELVIENESSLEHTINY